MVGMGSMNVTIHLFAGLAERAGQRTLELTGLPEDLTVSGLKAALGERHPELGDLTAVRGVLGTAYAEDGDPVRGAGDASFLPPVSGGAPDPLEAGVFELSADPLDPGAAIVRVGHPSCGAVVLFTGMTRQRNRDREVERLDYEAFEGMAGPEMARIFEEVLRLHGPDSAESEEPALDRSLRMLTVHRTGTVGVGEVSVLVAVASPHRDAAFLAARELIDRLKERVPVWKKECYGDGHHWIGERS